MLTFDHLVWLSFVNIAFFCDSKVELEAEKAPREAFAELAAYRALVDRTNVATAEHFLSDAGYELLERRLVALRTTAKDKKPTVIESLDKICNEFDRAGGIDRIKMSNVRLELVVVSVVLCCFVFRRFCFQFISFLYSIQLISFYFISFHFISFISFHSFHFISFISFH